VTRIWPQGEAVLVTLDQWRRPLRFTWRGQTHQVGAVHQQWQVNTDWWSDEGQIWRDYFALTTTSGLLCVIFYDRPAEEWRIAKVYD
jgi:hypothetical protein